ncbi:hypothetical protein D3C76_1385660 [compost metagenome]
MGFQCFKNLHMYTVVDGTYPVIIRHQVERRINFGPDLSDGSLAVWIPRSLGDGQMKFYIQRPEPLPCAVWLYTLFHVILKQLQFACGDPLSSEKSSLWLDDGSKFKHLQHL